MRCLALTCYVALSAAAGSASAETAQTGSGLPVIDQWDLDQDGTVTLAEAQSKRSDLFESHDIDGDGHLSQSEYEAFLNRSAAELEMLNKRYGKDNLPQGATVNSGLEMSFNDGNGDGRVSVEEFNSRSHDWFGLMDVNGDARITPLDF